MERNKKKITKTSFIVDIVVKCSQVIASAVTFNAYVTHFKQSPVYADNCGTERVRIEHWTFKMLGKQTELHNAVANEENTNKNKTNTESMEKTRKKQWTREREREGKKEILFNGINLLEMCFCFTAAESKSLYGHHYSAWFITSGLNKRPIHSEQRTIHIPLVRWMRSHRCLCSMWIVRTALLTLAALMHARNDLVSCERHRTINNATNERCKSISHTISIWMNLLASAKCNKCPNMSI